MTVEGLDARFCERRTGNRCQGPVRGNGVDIHEGRLAAAVKQAGSAVDVYLGEFVGMTFSWKVSERRQRSVRANAEHLKLAIGTPKTLSHG